MAQQRVAWPVERWPVADPGGLGPGPAARQPDDTSRRGGQMAAGQLQGLPPALTADTSLISPRPAPLTRPPVRRPA